MINVIRVTHRFSALNLEVAPTSELRISSRHTIEAVININNAIGMIMAKIKLAIVWNLSNICSISAKKFLIKFFSNKFYNRKSE